MAQAEKRGRAGPRYSLLHANLRFDNDDPKGFLRLAGEIGADVMTLNEVSKRWLPALETLKAAYPHQLVCTADSAIGGVAILSKRPFVDNAENGCSNGGALALQHVDFGGREAVVGSAHLFWPWPHGQPGRSAQCASGCAANGKAGMPMIFAGDLNAVRWSHSAKRIASFLGARRVPVAGGTWLHHTAPADYISWFGLPIDNVMARGISGDKRRDACRRSGRIIWRCGRSLGSSRKRTGRCCGHARKLIPPAPATH